MNYKNFIQEHINTMEEELKDIGITPEEFKEEPDHYIAEYLDDKYLYNEELETLKKQYQKLRRPADWKGERSRILTQIWEDMINAILKN